MEKKLTKERAGSRIRNEFADMLDGYLLDEKGFNEALEIFGLPGNIRSTKLTDRRSFEKALTRFAAALEYFGGDTKDVAEFATALTKAHHFFHATYESGKTYIFIPDAKDYYSLGRELLRDAMGARKLPPAWADDYINFAKVGKDYARDTQGKCTEYGFFAPMNQQAALEDVK